MEVSSFLAYSLGVVGFAILGVILFLVGMAVWGNIGDWKKHLARKKQREEKARREDKMMEHYGGGW